VVIILNISKYSLSMESTKPSTESIYTIDNVVRVLQDALREYTPNMVFTANAIPLMKSTKTKTQIKEHRNGVISDSNISGSR
jgi:hypothetical protein